MKNSTIIIIKGPPRTGKTQIAEIIARVIRFGGKTAVITDGLEKGAKYIPEWPDYIITTSNDVKGI